MRALVALFLLTILAGCNRHPIPVVAKPASSTGSVVDGQENKDRVVVGSSRAVDAAVAGTPAQAAVNAATEAQRMAVAAAPAAEVKKALDERDVIIKNQTLEADRLRAEVASLKDAELKTQARTLRFIGVGALLVAGLLGYAHQYGMSGASLLTGVICFGLAQLISQPWFMPAVGGLTVVAIVAFGVAAWHSYKKGTLVKDTEAEAAELKATLAKVVPALDEAIKSVDSSAQDKIIGALRGVMDGSQKAVIHDIRAHISRNK